MTRSSVRTVKRMHLLYISVEVAADNYWLAFFGYRYLLFDIHKSSHDILPQILTD